MQQPKKYGRDVREIMSELRPVPEPLGLPLGVGDMYDSWSSASLIEAA